MKLFASLLLILSFAPLAAAKTYTAYTVAGVRRTAADVYAATVDDSNAPGSKAPIPPNGTALIVATNGCSHVPGNGGESGIILNGPLGRSLTFANGETCAIRSVTAK
jgi:hypothetical protein